MRNSLALAARETGSKIPVSIPTAAAIESLIALQTEWVDQLWINLRTLHRNLLSSVDTSVRDVVTAQDVVEVLRTEIAVLIGAIPELSQNKTKLVFYCCNFSDLELILPNAILKPNRTDLQIKLAQLEIDVMKILLKDKEVTGFKEFKTKLNGENGDALVITHHPIDLLSANTFNRLRLLESHTGAIKPKSEWNTKLTKGNDITNIPFNKFSLQVFGDNNIALTQMDQKTREVVLHLAQQNRWSPVTTMDRIVFSINGLRDHFAKTILLKFCRS